MRLPAIHPAARSVRLIETAAELQSAEERLREQFRIGADVSRENIGFHGGQSGSATVLVHPALGIWGCIDEAAEPLETRFWNAFGTDARETGITVEVNPVRSGVSAQVAGAFALDTTSGHRLLLHNGRIGGGREGIGPARFWATTSLPTVSVERDGRSRQYVVVADIDAENVPEQVASFVREVRRIKDGQEPEMRTRSAVWVEKTRVRGRPDRLEGENALGKALWSPQKSDSGADIYRFMRDVRSGDVVLHLTDNEGFTGISRAAGPVQEFDGVADTDWKEGASYRVPLTGFQRLDPTLDFAVLASPPHLELLEALLDSGEKNLFYERRRGALTLHQGGYLTPASNELVSILDEAYQSRTGRHLFDESTIPSVERRVADPFTPFVVGGTPDADEAAERVEAAVRASGFSAFWWSHPLQAEKNTALEETPYLYIYHSRQAHQELTLRYHVVESRTSETIDGIESPWPEYTPTEWVGKAQLSDEKSQVFRTWFLVDAVERLVPPVRVAALESPDGKQAHPNRLLGGFGLWQFKRPVSQERTDYVTREEEFVPDLPIEWLVEETGLEQAFLEEIVSALNEPRGGQVVLSGPPGTGKTWLARAIARFLTRDNPAAHRLVQFHPTYSYEEFIEGLRPVAEGGAISFEVTPGVVLRMVAEMTARDTRRVLVIDEMNRANLPKVLGELLLT